MSNIMYTETVDIKIKSEVKTWEGTSGMPKIEPDGGILLRHWRRKKLSKEKSRLRQKHLSKR